MHTLDLGSSNERIAGLLPQLGHLEHVASLQNTAMRSYSLFVPLTHSWEINNLSKTVKKLTILVLLLGMGAESNIPRQSLLALLLLHSGSAILLSSGHLSSPIIVRQQTERGEAVLEQSMSVSLLVRGERLDTAFVQAVEH